MRVRVAVLLEADRRHEKRKPLIPLKIQFKHHNRGGAIAEAEEKVVFAKKITKEEGKLIVE